MPITFKFLLYLTTASVIFLASMSFAGKTAAEQHEADHQQIRRWITQSMVELERKTADGAASERHSPVYEVCARAVRDDYSDDPVKAYWWVRTLCHH